jgi:PhnB protein
MKRIDAYLFFEDNCREAMTFYHECLGGDLNFMTVGESPVANQMPPHMANRILHACLKNNEVMIMASDNCVNTPIIKGTNVSLSLSCSSESELYALFDKLAAGGEITNPPKAEFWGDIFGMLTDRFGFNWMLAYTQQKP